MYHAFSPRLDNAVLSHRAGVENNIKGGEKPEKSIYSAKRQRIFDIYYLLREICVIRDRLGDRYYGRCVVMLGDPPTPFGVGGLNSIALALVPYRHVRICLCVVVFSGWILILLGCVSIEPIFGEYGQIK